MLRERECDRGWDCWVLAPSPEPPRSSPGRPILSRESRGDYGLHREMVHLPQPGERDGGDPAAAARGPNRFPFGQRAPPRPDRCRGTLPAHHEPFRHRLCLPRSEGWTALAGGSHLHAGEGAGLQRHGRRDHRARVSGPGLGDSCGERGAKTAGAGDDPRGIGVPWGSPPTVLTRALACRGITTPDVRQRPRGSVCAGHGLRVFFAPHCFCSSLASRFPWDCDPVPDSSSPDSMPSARRFPSWSMQAFCR